MASVLSCDGITKCMTVKLHLVLLNQAMARNLHVTTKAYATFLPTLIVSFVLKH